MTGPAQERQLVRALMDLCPQACAQRSGKAAVNGDDPSVPPTRLQNPFKAVHSAHTATFLPGVK